MGQQHQQAVTAEAGSSTLRRIVLALLVAVLMGATMAASAMPAFAKGRPAFGGAPDSICANVITQKNSDAPACFRS